MSLHLNRIPFQSINWHFVKVIISINKIAEPFEGFRIGNRLFLYAKRTQKSPFDSLIYWFFSPLSRFINQQNSYSAGASNEFLSSVNVRTDNCTLTNARHVSQNLFHAGSGIIVNYPYTINQPLVLNCYAGMVIQPGGSPAFYYYLPMGSSFNQNQYVLVNTIHQLPSTSNIQVSGSNAMLGHSLSNTNEKIDRQIFETYNISFDDSL